MRQGIVFGPDYSSDRRTIREAALTSLSRAALATALNVFNRSIDPGSYVAKAWPEDRTARLITRGAVDPIDTADAAALVTVAMAFASALVGQSAGAASFERALKLRFEGGAGAISIPNVAIAGGGFVHEGDAMPVIKGTTTAAQLRPYKLGAITVLSVEMLRSVNAEQLIRSALLESTAANLDAVLFDDQPRGRRA